MKDITRKYTNGEVTIVWKPSICVHSTICFTGLPEVFKPMDRPWVTPECSTTERMIEQVKKCPSGALSYYMNNESHTQSVITGESIVEVVKNGPLLVYGNITIKDKDGKEMKKDKVTAFCRCGASSNKPYCDGTHVKIGFND
ncbi:MAG: (4Fe-4S)-binding protein [bacterium]